MRRAWFSLLTACAVSVTGCATTYVPCKVTSDPTSAEVWVGSELRDSTPCNVLFSAPGEYELTLKKPGFRPVLRRVTVIEGVVDEATGEEGLIARPEAMEVVLDPDLAVAAAGPTVLATCRVESNPPSAEVWVGTEQRDSTPCELVFREPGEYEVYLKKPGYLTVLRRVTVLKQVDRRTGKVALIMQPESMTVTLDPQEPDAGAEQAPTSKPYYE